MRIEDLNPTDGGSNYLIIDCPNCGHHEAFIYKDDIEKARKNPRWKIKWICNRRNKCGASGILEDISRETIKKPEPEKQDQKLTEDQIAMLENLCRYLVNAPVPFSIRGISSEVLTKNDFIYYEKGFQKFLEMKSMGKLQGKFRAKAYENRDIFFPIFGPKGDLQRLLLRSKEAEQKKKEIQVKITNPATEIWNYKCLLNKDKETIFICEGIYDALSVLEAAKNRKEIDAIAVSGCTKFKKVIREIKSIKDCLNKRFVVCLDNDEAGKRALKELKQIENFTFSVFDLGKHKDMNDHLIEDFSGFKKKILLMARKKR